MKVLQRILCTRLHWSKVEMLLVITVCLVASVCSSTPSEPTTTPIDITTGVSVTDSSTLELNITDVTTDANVTFPDVNDTTTINNDNITATTEPTNITITTPEVNGTTPEVDTTTPEVNVTTPDVNGTSPGVDETTTSGSTIETTTGSKTSEEPTTSSDASTTGSISSTDSSSRAPTTDVSTPEGTTDGGSTPEISPSSPPGNGVAVGLGVTFGILGALGLIAVIYLAYRKRFGRNRAFDYNQFGNPLYRASDDGFDDDGYQRGGGSLHFLNN